MDVGCTAVCWSLNASTFIILFDMYIQHFPFHILLPSLFPLFLVETWEPISLGFHTLTPGMPQRLLVKLLVLFACFFFRQQFDGIYSRDTTLVLVNSLNGTGVHTCIITNRFYTYYYFVITFSLFVFYIFLFFQKFLYVFLTIKC